jgi:hypothetical protein
MLSEVWLLLHLANSRSRGRSEDWLVASRRAAAEAPGSSIGAWYAADGGVCIAASESYSSVSFFVCLLPLLSARRYSYPSFANPSTVSFALSSINGVLAASMRTALSKAAPPPHFEADLNSST